MHSWWAYETSFKMYYRPQTLSILLQSHDILGQIFRLHWSNKFSWVCSESSAYLDPEQKGQHRPVHYSWRTERENTEQCLKGLHLWCTFGPPAPRAMSSTVSQPDPTTFNSSRITAASGNAGRTLADPTLPPPGLEHNFDLQYNAHVRFSSLFMPLIWFQAFSRWLGDRSHGGLKQWQKLKAQNIGFIFIVVEQQNYQNIFSAFSLKKLIKHISAKYKITFVACL